MRLLSVGEMARRCATTVKALHVYQQKGLLEPFRVDESNGRRYYSIEQCTAVDTIVRLRGLGFTLDEVRELVVADDLQVTARAIDARVKERERDLAIQRVALFQGKLLAAYYRESAAIDVFGIPQMVVLPERYLVWFEQDLVRRYLPDTSIEHEIKEWHEAIQMLKTRIEAVGLAGCAFMNSVSVVGRENLLTRRFESNRAGVLCGASILDVYPQADFLPAGEYVVLWRRLEWSRDGAYVATDTEYDLLARLVDFVETHGRTIASDAHCALVIETPEHDNVPWRGYVRYGVRVEHG